MDRDTTALQLASQVAGSSQMKTRRHQCRYCKKNFARGDHRARHERSRELPLLEIICRRHVDCDQTLKRRRMPADTVQSRSAESKWGQAHLGGC